MALDVSVPIPYVETRAADFARRRPASRWRLWMVLATVAAGAIVWLCYSVGFLGENLRTVEDGRCYRSAQLSSSALERHITALGIRRVINLRGDRGDSAWYADELKLCARLHVEHLDFKLDPQRLPRPEVLRGLMNALASSTAPTLMHCRSGADRTGLAAVLYKVVVQAIPLDDAIREQLSWRSGHIRTQSSDAAERLFELFRETADGKNLREWVVETYPAVYAAKGPYGGADAAADMENSPYGVVFTGWKLFGMVGVLIFTGRWFVQMHCSRKAGKPETPPLFWIMSMIGSVILLVYFTVSPKRDLVGVLSNFFPLFVSAYNLYLNWGHQRKSGA